MSTSERKPTWESPGFGDLVWLFIKAIPALTLALVIWGAVPFLLVFVIAAALA